MDIKGLKISVDAGHCLKGADTGGVGIANEYNMNVEVKNLVISKLKALDAIVTDCSVINGGTLSNSLYTRCNISNKFSAKYHLCLHHNCYNGKANGAEVEYYSTEGAKLAQCTQDEFVKLGFRNRGIKYRDDLYILKHTNAVCILTECGFVDNITDMKIYNAEKEANAIVNGLLNYLKSK